MTVIDYIVFIGAVAITFAIVPIVAFSIIVTIMLVNEIVEYIQDHYLD